MCSAKRRDLEPGGLVCICQHDCLAAQPLDLFPPPGPEGGSCAHREEAEPSPTSSQDVAQDQRAQELRVSLVFLIKPVVPCLVS